MSYSHVPTEILTDMAEDFHSLALGFAFRGDAVRLASAKKKLNEIDLELSYRQPEIEFRDLEDGFEPEVYVKTDEALEEFNYTSGWDLYGFTIGSFL